MKRRDFIQYATSSFFLPLILDGFGAKAHTKATTPFMKAMQQIADANDRILVVIQLNGGNDGLNMVLPLDQYSTYTASNFRGNIAIPENKVLKLNGKPETGLHPSMTGLQTLYNEGKLSIIQAAGYANPSFSHFRASDIWFTAVDSDKISTSGWLGRYVENTYDGFPDNYPSSSNPDPLAIQISSISSTAFVTSSASAALAIQDPDTFAKIVGDKPNIISGDLPDTPAGKYTAFIRQQQISSVAYAGQLKIAAGKGKNLVTYPTQNTLADQLKIVSRLIAGGLQTKIYYVTLGGFDTHSNQVNAGDTSVGSHADLLGKLSSGIKAFMDDLKAQGNDNKVVGMTFSEFGRRAISNGSRGTDHGWASPLFVFGNAVKTQMIGKNPNLKDLDNNNIKLQTDFRQVYASILTDWMGASEATVKTILLDKTFSILPIFRQQQVLGTETEVPGTNFKIYPNPAVGETILESDKFNGGISDLQLSDMTGRNYSSRWSQLSANKIRLDLSNLPSGKYLVCVETRQEPIVGTLVVSH
ncbi:Por secretion system C-terminal sorting domain-containing protein [Pseudarcicella hirudinis]|uniref:Por secretion system C-terminal sorting domain-containing protein n=1 Tax=Pseudarcicella hirudinis TaxID=1079859 RepID=A0A1I5NQH2_9BACT|nr:DUF1501 domain-containing protein [Pseudarcicella hirudinis]SFP23481.1 Por secretion system C-terminal sorting domain-containing protein [Pseudarcicella hirudinis]